MSLNLALSLAQAGLAHTNRQLGVVSSNIANAETPGFTRKTRESESVVARDVSIGLKTTDLQRNVSYALQGQLWRSYGDASAYETRQSVLERVSLAHGRPEEGSSIGDFWESCKRGSFSSKANPSDASLHAAVVTDAESVVLRFSDTSMAIGRSRQEAHDQIVEEIEGLNADLREIGRLTNLLRQQITSGFTGPDIEDQRDAVISRLAERVSIKVNNQPDGSVLITTAAGQPLPTGNAAAVSTTGAVLGAGAFRGALGTIPGIIMGGADITDGLSGGRLGALISLRDETLPRMQGELDEAAQKLAIRFEEQGLRLFSDADGNVPPGGLGPPSQTGYVGFSGEIRANPAVRIDPRLVRDGTHDVVGVVGGPGAFTTNPPGGPAAFTTLIDRILSFSLGDTVSQGNLHPGFVTTGIGPAGAISSSFVAPRSIVSFATTMTMAQTSDIASAGDRLREEETLRDLLQSRYQDRVGVDVDEEMAHLIVLQNAYAANARVISAVQTMWDAMIGMIR